MVDRIKQVMEYEQMSPANFADAIDINRSSLTHIFTGRNQPSLDVARKILKAFPEIRTEWLIMGVGQMLQEISQQQTLPSPVVTTVDNMQQTDLFSGMEVTARKQLIEDVKPAVQAEEVNKTSNTSVEPEAMKSEVPNRVVEEKVSVKASSSTTGDILESQATNENGIQEEAIVSGRGRNAKFAESHISTGNTKREKISVSQGDKKIAKIIFFYDDKSFEIYLPN